MRFKYTLLSIGLLIIAILVFYGIWRFHFQVSPVGLRVKAAQIPVSSLLEEDVGELFSFLHSIGVNLVVVQCFSDEGVYFESSIAPVVVDLLGSWVGEAHACGLEIYAWMTSLNQQWLLDEHPDWGVVAYVHGEYTRDTGWWNRVCPNNPQIREILATLYLEIAQTGVDGILIQDDLYLSENECFCPICRLLFKEEFGKPLKPRVIMHEDELIEFCKWKNRKLLDLIWYVKQRLIDEGFKIHITMNIYPEGALNPIMGLEWFGQDIRESLKVVDSITIMAYHRLNRKSTQWIRDVAEAALRQAGNPSKVILKVQTIDFKSEKPIPEDELQDALNQAISGGAINLAYFPEEPDINHDPIMRTYNQKQVTAQLAITAEAVPLSGNGLLNIKSMNFSEILPNFSDFSDTLVNRVIRIE